MHARGFVRDFKPMDVLTEEEVEQIHRGAPEVLTKTGVRVESRRALDPKNYLTLGALFRAVLPVTMPKAIATAVFEYIFGWTELLFAVIFLRTRVATVPVEAAGYRGSEAQLWGQAGVMALLSMIPVFVIGLAVQKHFARALTLGYVMG